MWWSARLAAIVTIAAPWRCPENAWIDSVPAPAAIAPSTTPTSTAKSPDHTPERVSTAPPPKSSTPRVTLPEAVVVRALDVSRAAFVGCFARAHRVDPSLGPLKVTLHLEIDPDGLVTSVTTDTDITKLSNCLSGVARTLKFTAPAELAAVDVPLFY